MIHAGTARHGQHLVLLHELTHWLTQAGHTRAFWDTAFALYRWYGVPLRNAYTSEQHTRRRAHRMQPYRPPQLRLRPAPLPPRLSDTCVCLSDRRWSRKTQPPACTPKERTHGRNEA